MAELLLTMAVGPLVSMVKEKASSYLLDQYQVMEGMEEQHEVLKRKLPAIIDVMADAEEQAANHREGAKAWLEAVRKVAYKANDVLDEFKYEALRRKVKADGHYKKLSVDVIKLFPTHNHLVFRDRMAKKLRTILQEIDVLIEEMNAFRFKFKRQPPMAMKWEKADACIPMDCMDIADESRAQEKKDLIDKLLTQATSKDLMVLPIVGMGGLGKTTLAQLVYSDPQIQEHFELRLWVCVSDNFNVDSLAEKIVKEAANNGCQATSGEENAQHATGYSALDKLQKVVSGKRYLLVLDDVWNRDEPSKWGKLKSYLQYGGRGSSVLTTTRYETVAKLMVGTTEGSHKIKRLDADFIKEIIETRAFSSATERPADLLRMIDDVANICSGSPLVATVLGSLLRTKTTENEWKDVLSRTSICDAEDKILPVLKLSYSGFMRQCFAFCAMFPKDYEIDVEMLIQLWMANGFIPEKQGEHPEIIGKNIFVELASRSCFQDVKGNPFQFNHTVSRTTCKIHDLMHDAAMDSMGNECATIDTKPSRSADFPYSARYLFLSVDEPEAILNTYLEKRSPTFQTLICDGNVKDDMKILSKYNSIRALKINGGSTLRPKYLQHLRYLDLSRSEIKALPKDISILYLLQTLNISYCHNLERLPKQLKYLTALRHLYTHGCRKLKSMSPELGHLISLQTLTCFVAGTDSSCSNLGELQNLDLGGTLELSKLENVTGADAQAAGLGNKKKLTELELCWTDGDQEAQDNNHEEVVEGLKPHDGLKALRINRCGSSTLPAWISRLRGMVELVLFGCKELEKLPALWQLPALQILRLQELESLNCLCSGGTTPVTFPKLNVLILFGMAKFEAWWETDVVQGEEPIFPEVEELVIKECKSLTALPKAASKISGVGTKCRSAFPALRKMTLGELTMFERWEAGEVISGEEVTFPRLEELLISNCGRLSALPKGSLLAKQSFGRAEMAMVTFPCLQKLSMNIIKILSALQKGSFLNKESFSEAETVCGRSAFPALRKLWLSGLLSLERWGAAEGTPGEEVTFPLLENLRIEGCPKLTDLPEALKLSGLVIQGDDQQISLQAASRCLPSLSSLELDALPRGEFLDLQVMRRWHRNILLPAMWLTGCNLLFSHSSALALWTHFAHLVDLDIWNCDTLVYWPENVFQVLVCLRNLSIYKCSKLTGSAQASDEQSAPAPERGGLLPCLESLEIDDCVSLVEVPILPASLKTLHIVRCSNIVESIVFGQQEDMRLVTGEGVVRPDTSSLIRGSSSSEATASRAVLKLSSAANHCFLPFPCLESLNIQMCSGLSEVVNLPPFIKTLDIDDCDNLQSLSGQLDTVQKLCIRSCSRFESLEPCLGDLRSLEELKLSYCSSMVSLPDGPQAYSSLRVLELRCCDGIKVLPPSLQSRLDYLNEKILDAHLEEPKTLTCTIKRMADKAGVNSRLMRFFRCSLRQKVTLGRSARNSKLMRLFRCSLRRKVTLGWCARNSRPRSR